MTTNCVYRSSWTDSGDRGADMADHNRSHHADHAHVWGDSSYDWEQVGTTHYVKDPDNLPRTMQAIRTVPEQRCTVCALRPAEDRTGLCG
jgi:hypothetical protein